jgi:hypothetical protein
VTLSKHGLGQKKRTNFLVSVISTNKGDKMDEFRSFVEKDLSIILLRIKFMVSIGVITSISIINLR